MYRRRFIATTGAVAVAGLAVPNAIRRAGAQATYSVTDLGRPDGFDSVIPVAIADTGAAAVIAQNAAETAIFLVRDGAFTRVSAEGERPWATCIDQNGRIGGWIEGPSDGSAEPFDEPILFTESGQLEMPGDQVDGRVLGLGQDDRAVGEAATSPDHAFRQAVIWDDQEIARLRGASEDRPSVALDINALGQIPGWIATSPDDPQARTAVVFHVERDPVDLGTLGGSASEAVAISEQGQVVGRSTTTANGQLGEAGTVAFSWFGDALTPLPLLDGFTWSEATDVNSVGLITGTMGGGDATPTPSSTIAVIWGTDTILPLDQHAAPLDGLRLTSAVSINELGQVLCSAIDGNGLTHAVVLSIVGN